MFKKQAGELIVRSEGLKARRFDLDTHDVDKDTNDNIYVFMRKYAPNGNEINGSIVAFFSSMNVQCVEIRLLADKQAHPQIEGLTS